jgi:hypothetical protein
MRQVLIPSAVFLILDADSVGEWRSCVRSLCREPDSALFLECIPKIKRRKLHAFERNGSFSAIYRRLSLKNGRKQAFSSRKPPVTLNFIGLDFWEV